MPLREKEPKLKTKERILVKGSPKPAHCSAWQTWSSPHHTVFLSFIKGTGQPLRREFLYMSVSDSDFFYIPYLQSTFHSFQASKTHLKNTFSQSALLTRKHLFIAAYCWIFCASLFNTSASVFLLNQFQWVWQTHYPPSLTMCTCMRA